MLTNYVLAATLSRLDYYYSREDPSMVETNSNCEAPGMLNANYILSKSI